MSSLAVGPRLLVPAVALLLSTSASASAPRPVQLSYSVEPGIEGCPDERWVRQSVAARLGFDPFAPGAPVHVEATITRVEEALAGAVFVSDAGGSRRGRQLSSASGDCLELASAMELAIAIAVDPHYLTRATPPPAPAEAARVAPPPPEAAPGPTPARPPAEPPVLSAIVGAHLASGLSPGAVLGLTGGARLRSAHWSVSLGARADLAGATPFGGGMVRGSVLLGSASACAHVGAWAACGVVSAGALQVTGELAEVVRASSPLVLAGFRGEGELLRQGRFALRPFLELQAVLTRTTVSSGARPVWVTSPVAGRLGLATSFDLL